MTVGLLALKNDDNNVTWITLTNNEIGIDVPELAEALQKSRSVRKVSCHAGFLGSLTHHDLQLLIFTIAKLSNLQDLWLALPAKQAFLSRDILKTILVNGCAGRQLKKLTMRGMDDAACVVLAKALKRPGVAMTELQIRGSPAPANGNNQMVPPVASKVTRRGILVMAQMLQVNQSLQRLDLCYKGLDTKCCQAMAKALSVNKNLKRLEIITPPAKGINNNCGSLEEGYQALIQTMRSNYTLHHLTAPAEGDFKAVLELFPKLNRTGSRAVLHNTTGRVTLDGVLDLLQDNIKDASVLYEMLSEMPALWDPVRAAAVGLGGEKPTMVRRAASAPVQATTTTPNESNATKASHVAMEREHFLGPGRRKDQNLCALDSHHYRRRFAKRRTSATHQEKGQQKKKKDGSSQLG